MGRVLVAAGAQATEEALLRQVDADQQRVAVQPSLLARPLRIVVPSRSLRDHVSARLVARRSAAAGVLVQTHLQLAFQIVEQTGPLKVHDAALEILIQRFADAHDVLQPLLGDLVQGYRVVAQAADDLYHAGLDEDLAPVLDEAVAKLGDGPLGRRTRALLETSLSAQRALAREGLASRDGVLLVATRRLEASPDALAARALLVHGFADATGVVTALLEALLRREDATLLLDRPADPARPDRTDRGWEFSRPFGQRLGEGPHPPAPEGAAPIPEAFTAPGGRAEAREVARRIRALLDGPEAPPPERIGVVARSLEGRLLDLGEALDAYGVPWQAPGRAGVVDAAGRRLRALAEILRRGAQCPVAVWRSALPARAEAWRLRLALAVLGAARLEQAARLDLDSLLPKGSLRLPIHRGVEVEADEDGGERILSPREQVPRAEVQTGRDEAAALLRGLEEAPARATCQEHRSWLGKVLDRLAWEPDDEARRRAAEVLGSLPSDLVLSRDEVVGLVAEALEKAARPGRGDGGGVRVLDVTQARALTFDVLFAVGLNRGAFPPRSREDPLLPDGVRLALLPVLPDLKPRRDRSREERYLFAQLLSAADRVTLSWWSTDEDGRPVPPSPFVQRLHLRLGGGETPAAPSLLEVETPSVRPRPLREHLLQAGLAGRRERLAALLPAALAREGGPQPDPAVAWAGAARAVLDEWERRPEDAPDLGPWMGAVGSLRPAAVDQRRGTVWVTALETLSRCPWQHLLRRVLRLEPLPDPLETLPLLDPLTVGNVVHAVLERIAVEALGRRGGRLAERLGDAPAPAPWPDRETLRRYSHEAAAGVLLEEGRILPGLAHALATRADAYLEVARQELWKTGPPQVLGAEVSGETRLDPPGAPSLVLGFRADLVERREDGLRCIDFKTGASFSQRVKAESRHEDLLRGIASGRHLQGYLYALAATSLAPGGGPARGAYLHLRDDADPRTRWMEVPADDAAAGRHFLDAVGLLERARRRGLLPPRLTDARGRQENPACAWCEVAAACVRGETQARRREVIFFQQLRRRRDEGDPLSADQELLLDLWERPEVKP